MKILVVCQHYYPENFQITDICEELVKHNNQVHRTYRYSELSSGRVLYWL